MPAPAAPRRQTWAPGPSSERSAAAWRPARDGGESVDFSFGRVRVHPLPQAREQPVQPVQPAGTPPAADDGGGAGEAAPLDSSPPTPQLTLSGVDRYDDGSQSSEVINYVVGVPKGVKAQRYCLVQWTQGFAKDGAGNFMKTQVYGAIRDWNDPEWVVDSTDEDPVYGSVPGGPRWNYNLPLPEAFTTSDAPGPATSSMKGAVYAARFKVAVYETEKVPTKTTGKISVEPLTPFQFWSYSVVVGQDGKFTHPKLA